MATPASNESPTRTGGTLWRHPDFMKFWIGETISLVGMRITGFALPYLAITVLGASSAQLGLLRTVEFVPFVLLTLLAGVWVDRSRRLRIMVTTNALRAVLLVTVPILYAMDRLEIWHLYVIVLLAGICRVFFDVSYLSYLPSLVTRSQLVEGNSKLTASDSAANVGGPGLAGVLVQWLTAPVTVLLDAVSYAVSVVTLLSIRTREHKPQRPERTRGLRALRDEITDGVKVILRNRYLRMIAGEGFTYNFFVQFGETIFLLYAVRQLGYNAGTVGLIISTGSVGAVLGSFVAPRVVDRLGFGPAFLWGTALACAAPILVPLADGPRLVMTAMLIGAYFFSGIGVTISVIGSISLRQGITPNEILGRMNASMRLATYAAVPIGSLAAGFLGAVVGLRLALLVGAIGFVLPVLFILLSPIPRLKELRDDAAVEERSGTVTEPVGPAATDRVSHDGDADTARSGSAG